MALPVCLLLRTARNKLNLSEIWLSLFPSEIKRRAMIAMQGADQTGTWTANIAQNSRALNTVGRGGDTALLAGRQFAVDKVDRFRIQPRRWVPVFGQCHGFFRAGDYADGATDTGRDLGCQGEVFIIRVKGQGAGGTDAHTQPAARAEVLFNLDRSKRTFVRCDVWRCA